MTKHLATLFSAGALFISILACGGGGGDVDPDQPGSSFQQCNGIAGLQCDDPDEICVQDPNMCNVADASGTCQEQTTFCTEQYDPVCGCNGKTYGNACEAKVAGAAIAQQGECASEPVGQSCGTRGTGVCAKDQVCIWEQGANCGRADHPGTCQTPPQLCTQQYDPVCGCDGQTYGNECMAASAGVSVDTVGECDTVGQTCGGFSGVNCGSNEYCDFSLSAQCGWADATGTCAVKPQICTEQYDPVCGCDGQTYGNECIANAAGTAIVSHDACAQNGSN